MDERIFKQLLMTSEITEEYENEFMVETVDEDYYWRVNLVNHTYLLSKDSCDAILKNNQKSIICDKVQEWHESEIEKKRQEEEQAKADYKDEMNLRQSLNSNRL